MDFQQLGSQLAAGIGRNSSVVRLFRPAYERLLDRRGGFRRTMNGRETFLIDPWHRGMFPETYEPSVCEFLRANVSAGDICLDIGAHVGIYALCLARWSGQNGRVFAFEPNPETRALLESNVRRNPEGQRITVVPHGVSDRPGEEIFYAAGIEGFSRLGQPNRERPEEHRALQVPITTIDDFCLEQGIRPNWILIDIEGYEVAALRGAKQTILTSGSRIMVEMHPLLWESAGTCREEFAELLAEHRLAAVALSGQADVWAENGQVVLAKN
jgi:FkbM family methyltransferase